MVEGQKVHQPGGVGLIVRRAGLGQFQVNFLYRRCEQPLLLQAFEVGLMDAGRPAGRGLALENADIDAGFHRNPDGQVIAGDLGLAGQPVAFGLIFFADAFRAAAFHLSLFHENPAFGAHAVTAAGRIDMDAGFHGRTQQALAFRH